ncbi:hypothetical protein B0H16DRAFT_1740576 [Mycena metata]|uniref:Nephrocystin 3-like N-terminal domain-containing protein n=1 Tax=Mycena metata TaxID=1033252 RepID=A0AAD7HCD5_9AGAR|nr:hypothetical protein B0H16DRAFT_1740576 [Mycena metata]
MFPHSSNFQITGGHFINVAGDFNTLNGPDMLSALDVGQDSDRLLGGVERTERGGGHGALPYDTSQRRRVPARPNDTDTGSTLTPYFSTPPDGQDAINSSAHPHNTSQRRRIIAPSDNTDIQDSSATATSDLYGPSHDHNPRPQLHHQPQSSEDWARGSDPVGGASGPATDWRPLPLILASGPLAQNPEQDCPSEHPPTTRITGGTFIGGNVYRIQHQGEAGLHILHRATAGDAFHDSGERYPQPQCHPDTRTSLLEDLMEWARSSVSGHSTLLETQPILWLYGPAGSGKSAVAQSLCQRLAEEGRLGGSFFFKRGHPSRGEARKLFPTIAYQLALLLPELKQHITRTIENDPAIVDRSLSTQLHNLILNPCRRSRLARPVPIVIDGLDECDGEYVQQAILRAIGSALSQESLPIRFLVASRPEAHIRETLAESCLAESHRALNIRQSFKDVRKYLEVEFDRIHREHRTMRAVPFPWPDVKILEKIVRDSSGYFIYAATVIKFLDDKRFQPPERLDVILGIRHSISGSPLNALDQLYLQILSGVPEDFLALLLQIFVFAKEGVSLSRICRLLELPVDELHLILRGLHSLILVPEDDRDNISAHHASFWDFLDHPSRSGAFHVGSARAIMMDTTWGFFLRACPPPELLNVLTEFARASDCMVKNGASITDLYNVVQCLKTFRPIPVELIIRFEHEIGDVSIDRMEEDWTKWWATCQEYGKRLTVPIL